jgi:hypothetical protein
MSKAVWRKRWRWLSLPLAIGALAWTSWLLWGSIPKMLESLPKLHLGWLVFTLLGNIISGYLVFEAFRTLFEKIQPKIYSRPHLAHLYFSGQLLKHLPGRIWGVAYQAAIGNRTSMVAWISVTSVFMVLSTGFAVWVAGSVLGFMFGVEWGLFALVAGTAMYFFIWQEKTLRNILRVLNKLPFLKRLTGSLESFVVVDTKFKAQVGFWYIISWLIYFIAWMGYGMAWPSLSPLNAVWLCAIYTVAWFVGYISLVTPSGAGVRELVFVLLARDFPPDAVMGMAVFGRITLLLVDTMLGLVFLTSRINENEKI